MRKHLLEYDDVMNKQRETIYTLRRGILEGREGRDYVLNAAEDIAMFLLDTHLAKEEDRDNEWNIPELNAELYDFFGVNFESIGLDPREVGREGSEEPILEAIRNRYIEREKLVGQEIMRMHEKVLILKVLDEQWKDHLLVLDHLKEGIGLRGYGQRDPLIEYKKESFNLFQSMLERIQDRVTKVLFRTEIVVEPDQVRRQAPPPRLVMPDLPRQPRNLSFSAPAKEAPTPVKRKEAKVGRNEPCPCGSGKKYKKCHGAAQSAG